MDTLWMPEKLSRQAKPRIWHSHTLVYILRKPLIKRHRQPNKASALLPIAETHYPKISNEGLKLKQGVVHTYSGLFLTHKTPSLKLGNYDSSSHRDGPWRIILREVCQAEEDPVYEVPSRQNKCRHTRWQAYNPKWDWEFKVKRRVPEKRKWWPRNELGCLCLYTQKSVL